MKLGWTAWMDDDSHRRWWQRRGFRRGLLAGLVPLAATVWMGSQWRPAVQTATTETSAAAPLCVASWCREGLATSVGVLDCRYDLLGLPKGCPSGLLTGPPMDLRWADMPSALSLLGLAPARGVLLEARARDGTVHFKRRVSQQFWRALYGGWWWAALSAPLFGLWVAWRFRKGAPARSAVSAEEAARGR